jgi:lysyl-tRNA synthetase class I
MSDTFSMECPKCEKPVSLESTHVDAGVDVTGKCACGIRIELPATGGIYVDGERVDSVTEEDADA